MARGMSLHVGTIAHFSSQMDHTRTCEHLGELKNSGNLLFHSLLIIISNILSSVLCSDHSRDFIKHFMWFYQYRIVLLSIVFTYLCIV